MAPASRRTSPYRFSRKTIWSTAATRRFGKPWRSWRPVWTPELGRSRLAVCPGHPEAQAAEAVGGPHLETIGRAHIGRGAVKRAAAQDTSIGIDHPQLRGLQVVSPLASGERALAPLKGVAEDV